MSTYSLDSLEKYSSNDTKCTKTRETGRVLELTYVNPKNWKEVGKASGVDEIFDKDNEFNESSLPTTTSICKNNWVLVKSHGNVIIASDFYVTQKFSSRVAKQTLKLDTRSYFPRERPVAKKFNVSRHSSLSSTSASSSSEFRHDGTIPRKRPDDVHDNDVVLGFMKTEKKPGNVQIPIVNRSKKTVSYLELYRSRFGVNGRQCIRTLVGSTSSICDDRSNERRQPASGSDRSTSSTIPRDERHDAGFHRRSSQQQQIESRESRDTRSCEALDSFIKNASTGLDETRDDDFSPGSFQADVRTINRQRRVTYEPYDIEDYKSLSIPRPDRSLGPDRHEMESKGEWLMRRRTYGDAVSALNRQRIVRRYEKLKHSRRTDSTKLSLYPTLTDLKHPGPASKIEVVPEVKDKVMTVKNSSHPRVRSNGTKIKISPSTVRIKESSSILSKRKTKKIASSSVVNNMYETSSDTLDDESTDLKNLQKRHIEEKRTIDRLLKRGLCT